MTPLEDLIRLADASVAAGLAELKRETAARLSQQAGALDRIVREQASRSERLPLSGPRIAPKRTAPPALPATSHEPDAFFASIARRLKG